MQSNTATGGIKILRRDSQLTSHDVASLQLHLERPQCKVETVILRCEILASLSDTGVLIEMSFVVLCLAVDCSSWCYEHFLAAISDALDLEDAAQTFVCFWVAGLGKMCE